MQPPTKNHNSLFNVWESSLREVILNIQSDTSHRESVCEYNT